MKKLDCIIGKKEMYIKRLCIIFYIKFVLGVEELDVFILVFRLKFESEEDWIFKLSGNCFDNGKWLVKMFLRICYIVEKGEVVIG